MMPRKKHKFGIGLILINLALVIFPGLVNVPSAAGQDIYEQRHRGRTMLKVFRDVIKEYYYDPAYHGIGLDKHFAAAELQIDDAVAGDQIHGIMARALLAFGDSHTYFLPPLSAFRVDYGWEMQMIGETCYVTSVRPGSDAELKGLKPGDVVLSIFDIPVTRGNLWEIKYLFYGLRPLKAISVELQLNGKRKRAELLTTVTKTDENTVKRLKREQKANTQRFFELEKNTLLWRLDAFDLGDAAIADMIKRAGAYRSLVLDLRGNGGGHVHTLLDLIGFFFERDVKVGDRRGRHGSNALVAKTKGTKAFKGNLIVLVDSESGSAAELFARVVQLEKRGTVLGDITAGSVAEGRVSTHNHSRYKSGQMASFNVPYMLSVTISDIVMGDGKSLERKGVTPDELILPTAADLAGKNDPVQSRALEIAVLKNK